VDVEWQHLAGAPDDAYARDKWNVWRGGWDDLA
jgi:hypothetical protein